MYVQVEKSTENKSRSVADYGTNKNRKEIISRWRKVSNEIPLMLKKDAALWSAEEEDTGYTPTKVIKTKNGKKGIFRYRKDGDIIDSFINNNIAVKKDLPSEHLDADVIQIPVGRADHDLSGTYKNNAPGLNSDVISNGTRAQHFAHGDKSHGIERKNTYTWHHLKSLGKMELIDMNVHGAMFHYGGVSEWKNMSHNDDLDE